MFALIILAGIIIYWVGHYNGKNEEKRKEWKVWINALHRVVIRFPQQKIREFLEEETIQWLIDENVYHSNCEFPGCCMPISGKIKHPFCKKHSEEEIVKFLSLFKRDHSGRVWIRYLRMINSEREKFLRKMGIDPKTYFYHGSYPRVYLEEPPFFYFPF